MIMILGLCMFDQKVVILEVAGGLAVMPGKFQPLWHLAAKLNLRPPAQKL